MVKVYTQEVKIKKIKELFIFLHKIPLKYRTEEFVLSLEDYFNRNGDLSEKQFEALCDIYERLT